jgi:hypothetical protein
MTKDYEREYKYTLGENIKNVSHDILDLIIEVNSLENKDKAEGLKIVLVKTEKLKIYMRISCDLKIISPKQLGNLAEKIEEIERQINGWINYSSKV